MTRIECKQCAIRPWRPGDEPSLQRNADNYNVWRNLTDRFPHPYTADDARWWVENANAIEFKGFAIEVDGEAVGGVGCMAREDVYKFTGEIGYWLGEPYWGQGIVSQALGAFIPYLFERTNLVRLEAGVFERNARSSRVLEKNGFELESRQPRAAYKDGEFIDVLVYVRLRDTIPPELLGP